MSSPFVRRHQLGVKLRNLREAKGLTHEDIAAHLHQDRAKVSRLENGHIRPDAAEVMQILNLLEVREPEWRKVMELAGQAAKKGWWDKFGDSMGARQRVYADLESGADTIREYHQGVLPGLLQTPEYTLALVRLAQVDKSFKHSPERLLQARAKRQEQVLHPEGPHYEVILDEVGLRRYSSSPKEYAPQLHHIIALAESNPRVTVRVLPLRTAPVADFMPRGPLSIYTFPDPKDPTIVVEPSVTTDTILTQPKHVAVALQRYDYVQNAALSEVSSLSFLSSLADEISDTAGSSA
jgi:transcriptional regulator with XRE-family HTH domain